MKVMLTGAAGQLGRALLATAPPMARVAAMDHAALDISDREAVARAVAAETPDLIINTAAYTAVDKAEGEQALAFRINGEAPAHLAAAARQAGVQLVQISTDFVFDGGLSRPYRPDDAVNPLGVYGASKRMGEEAVLAALPGALVVRTAWVYAAHGHNFVRTMLRLMKERGSVSVVADQIGTPTHAASLARAVWALAQADAGGIHHFTDAGVASWYDFAVAIAEEAEAMRMVGAVKVSPVGSAEYPTPARRPAFSVLDKSATWAITGTPWHWRAELRLMLDALKEIEG